MGTGANGVGYCDERQVTKGNRYCTNRSRSQCEGCSKDLCGRHEWGWGSHRLCRVCIRSNTVRRRLQRQAAELGARRER